MSHDAATRLKAWFANNYNREQFRLSMGEISGATAAYQTVIGFLAQGVAAQGYSDRRYLAQLIETHEKLVKIIEDQQEPAGPPDNIVFNCPLVLGLLIGKALEAVAGLKKEDQDG